MKNALFALALLSIPSAFAVDTSWESEALTEFHQVELCTSEKGIELRLIYDYSNVVGTYAVTFAPEQKALQRAIVESIMGKSETSRVREYCVDAESVIGKKSSDKKSVEVSSYRLK